MTSINARCFTLAFVSFLLVMAGCSDVVQLSDLQPEGGSWHSKAGWQAEDYFSDPQVIALCRAIEADDLEEIDRLIAAGADVNAKGKGNMTPLLWAFPDNKLERFKRLLEHGADPNVITESDFGNPSAFHPGDSVTHMAARTRFTRYFGSVMEHGGDANLTDRARNTTPIHSVIRAGLPDGKARIQLLIDKGADLNSFDSHGSTPAMAAVGWFGQYDIALMILNAGADPGIYQENNVQKLVHYVVRDERRLSASSAEQRANYRSLVQWLAARGEAIEEARCDVARWEKEGRTNPPSKIKLLREEELAERLATERAEEAKPDERDQ